MSAPQQAQAQRAQGVQLQPAIPMAFGLTPTTPVFGGTYSEGPGYGKSAQAAAAFPNAYVIGPRNGIPLVSQALWGFVPMHDDSITDLVQLTQKFPEILRAYAGKIDAFVLDDFSVLADRTYRLYAPAVIAANNNNAHAAYTWIANIVATVRDQMREANVHCWFGAHAQPAWIEQGVRLKGRPLLPGKLAPKTFPALPDMILRATVDPTVRGWPVVYKVDKLDPDWETKDRTDVCWERTPANVRAILTHFGYKLSRAPGLEWQDELVEAAVQGLGGGNEPAKVYEWIYAQVAERTKSRPELTPKIFAWTAQDAAAVFEIRRHHAQRLAQSFQNYGY